MSLFGRKSINLATLFTSIFSRPYKEIIPTTKVVDIRLISSSSNMEDKENIRPMNMIVCVDAANGISINNSLPWHLPNEYKHFQRTTIHTDHPDKMNAVIMGRKCYESIPEKHRPLKERINVILSRTMPEVISETLIVTSDFEKALRLLTEEEPFKSKVETIWNLGGRDIYELGLKHPWMHKLVITRIEKTYLTDVKFPDVDWKSFELNDDFDGNVIEEKGVMYRIQSYTKKRHS